MLLVKHPKNNRLTFAVLMLFKKLCPAVGILCRAPLPKAVGIMHSYLPR
jgi:hypothetical protein